MEIPLIRYDSSVVLLLVCIILHLALVALGDVQYGAWWSGGAEISGSFETGF
jgi:hypothetical protein